MPPPSAPLIFKRRPNSPKQSRIQFAPVPVVSSFSKHEAPISPVKTNMSKLAADTSKKVIPAETEVAPILKVIKSLLVTCSSGRILGLLQHLQIAKNRMSKNTLM